jgi:hypothetical protein
MAEGTSGLSGRLFILLTEEPQFFVASKEFFAFGKTIRVALENGML